MAETIEKGYPDQLGASFDIDGVNFAIFSEHAESVLLCLFDNEHREIRQYELPGQSNGIWHGYLPGCQPGQRYGYRMRGRYAPLEGQRFNPAKLLIDPQARDLDGIFQWSPAVFDYLHVGDDHAINELDSAAFVPKCVVTSGLVHEHPRRPVIPWSETIIYEANVRGYTMRHPQVPDSEKGKFSGMRSGAILSHLKSLGSTSLELMPVQEFIDEEFLVKRGLRNFWGYNTINFFVPAGRYAGSNRRQEFRDMVNAIHDAGMEVILDVVYNHTGEGNGLGPTLSFRGIVNLAYYRTMPAAPGRYVNDTGCGNSVNVDHPQVRELILQSLRYWVADMGVDGFRFDLASILGRGAHGYSKTHPMLKAIGDDAALRSVKLIAEPWDVGPGGYQLGGFPSRWSEWNDRYRDSARRYWRGDSGEAAEFAKRIHGSSDIFELTGRQPAASINLLTAHDGFTLADLVSYEHRHNEANGEDNRDGHVHNFSSNYGVEGESTDLSIALIRRRQRLNLLTTLMVSQGTPMLLGGDEFGNSQQGNNNAYAQDNETGWIDWSGLDSDPEFFECVRALIHLRKHTPLLRQDEYRHGRSQIGLGWRDVEWFRADGTPMTPRDWRENLPMAKVLVSELASKEFEAVALLINPSAAEVVFQLPDAGPHCEWRHSLTCSDASTRRLQRNQWAIPFRAIACFTLEDLETTAQ
jgi:glycogen operon protein